MDPEGLGSAQVTSLLVEGGGEVNASFLMDGLAHRIAFFYAPKVLGGRAARKAVAGEGRHLLERDPPPAGYPLEKTRSRPLSIG